MHHPAPDPAVPVSATRRARRLSSVLLPLACSSALANTGPASQSNPVAELSQVTVTAANLRATALDDESKPVSVVTGEAIAATAPGSIVEAMKDVPGVTFSRAGGRGGQVVIRGINSNDFKAPLAIDGERFRGRPTLEYNLIDPATVERVEVVRGPASALYGSEAMAGLVNIVLRKPRVDLDAPFFIGVRPTFLGYASVNHERAGRVEVQGGGRGFDFMLGVSRRLADDYDTPVGTAFNSRYDDTQADATVGYSFSRNHRVALRVKAADTVTHRAGGLGGAPGLAAPTPEKDRVQMREDPIRERYVGLSYEGKPGVKGLARIEASVFRRQFDTRIVTTRRPSPGVVNDQLLYVGGPVAYGGRLVVMSDILPATLLTGGADFYHNDWEGRETAVESNIPANRKPRIRGSSKTREAGTGVFLLAEHEVNRWMQVSGNVRYDWATVSTETDVLAKTFADEIRANSKATDSQWTYAVGTLLKPLPWLHFAANYGTSFRMPGAPEKFAVGNYGGGALLPQPSLRPETGNTLDLSGRLRFNDLAANLTWYVSNYDDLIRQPARIYNGQAAYQRTNVGKARIQGLELDLRYRLTRDLSLKAVATHTHGTDRTAGRPLSYIAPLTGVLGLQFERGPFYASADWRLSRRKTRIDPTQERETGGYGVLDLYAGWNLKALGPSLAKTTLRLGIENVFNKTYVNPTTHLATKAPATYTNPLVEPGRNVKLTLTSTF